MPDYSLSDLAALTGLPPRTIRYYIAQGLVSAPGREGPSTRYPETTLARLRLIAKLRDAHLPLAAIRQHLAGLPDDALVRLATEEAPVPTPADSALDYIRGVLGEGRGAKPVPSAPSTQGALLASVAAAFEPALGKRSQWERIVIGPDIELHVRRPLSRRDNRLVERLIAFARQLQGEDRP